MGFRPWWGPGIQRSWLPLHADYGASGSPHSAWVGILLITLICPAWSLTWPGCRALCSRRCAPARLLSLSHCWHWPPGSVACRQDCGSVMEMATSAGPLTGPQVGTATTATWSKGTDHTWVKQTTQRQHWCKGGLKNLVLAKILERAKIIWCWDIISMECEGVHINSLTLKAAPRDLQVSYLTIFPLWHTDTRPSVPPAAVIAADSLTTPITLNLTITTREYLNHGWARGGDEHHH